MPRRRGRPAGQFGGTHADAVRDFAPPGPGKPLKPGAFGPARPPTGRVKGKPNNLTHDVRVVLAAIFARLAPKAEAWIERAAEEDPAKGAALLLKLAQHFVPTLARTEVVGEGGGALTITVLTLGAQAHQLPAAQRTVEV